MRIPFRLALLATIPLGAVSTAAHAEENLGTMTISANRTATAVANSGSSVTVITAEEIEKKQAVTALDVIRDVPGVNVAAYGGLGKATSLSIRGIGAKGVLILIDGVNVADPSSAQTTYDLANLQADAIERIEVLRGNQSTLYGSSAIGGVISITTKTGKGSGKVITGSGGAEWGSFGTAKTNVNARGETGGVYYSGAISGLTTQGIDVSKGGPDEDDGYKNLSANLKLGSDVVKNVGILDRLNVEATGRYLKAHNETDQFVNDTFDVDEKFRTVETSGKLAVTTDMWNGLLSNTVSAAQAVTRRDGYLGGNRGAYYGDAYYDSSITKYEYQGTLKPIDHNTFVFGVDRQRDQQNSDTNPATSTLNDGIFGNYILDLLDDDLTLTAGVRHDDHETFGGHTTWRTTAAYRIPGSGTRLHAGYGTGYRAPSLFELYDTAYNTGNPDLKPEESRGYDFGFEQSVFDDRLTFGSTFFNTRLQNAITGNPNNSYRYENIASARAFGFENTISADVTDEIRVTLNHTYLQARNNDTGETMPASPHHSANIRVDYSPEAVAGLDTWGSVHTASSNSDSGYSAKPYLGGYAIWDLGASYDVTEWSSVYARLENLTDKSYETRGGYAQPGRAGYVGFRAKF